MTRTTLLRTNLYMFSLVLLPLTLGSICANLAFVTNQIKWKMVNPQNYRLNVLWVALPAPAIEIAITVRQGKIVAATFVACEKDQTRYPTQTCETVKKYGINLLNEDFTASGLFEQADCNKFLKDFADWECSVQYDSRYGYPTEILHRAPSPILDGTSVIAVTHFQIDK